jgi:uncharacterized protein (DUF58 family)
LTRFRSPRLLLYSLISTSGVILSLVLGRTDPLLLTLPFLVVLAAAAIAARTRPELKLQITFDRAKALEGEDVEIDIEVATNSGTFQVAFVLDAAMGINITDPPEAVVVGVGSPATMRARIRCRRWGAYRLGGGRLQARDLLSAFVYERVIQPTVDLRVYPRPERLRSLLRPHSLRPSFGSLVSRAAGAGLEFADIREFAPGDQRRHVNWKATARRGRVHVNLFHPEWNSDVVLLVDTFAEVTGDTQSSLELAVSAATSAAIEFIRRRDRVGLLMVGGTIQWLLPGMGVRQLYRIVDRLMQTKLAFSYAWPDAHAIPQRVIPPGALLVALTPLVDRRMSAILLDLRARGHDVAVVEISADALLPATHSHREQLARRLWRLHRSAIRYRFQQAGLPVSVWEPGRPLQIPFLELQRFRRTSRRVHV